MRPFAFAAAVVTGTLLSHGALACSDMNAAMTEFNKVKDAYIAKAPTLKPEQFQVWAKHIQGFSKALGTQDYAGACRSLEMASTELGLGDAGAPPPPPTNTTTATPPPPPPSNTTTATPPPPPANTTAEGDACPDRSTTEARLAVFLDIYESRQGGLTSYTEAKITRLKVLFKKAMSEERYNDACGFLGAALATLEDAEQPSTASKPVAPVTPPSNAGSSPTPPAATTAPSSGWRECPRGRCR